MSIRKILVWFFCIALLMPAAGCSAKNESPQDSEEQAEEAQETAAQDEEKAALKEFSGNYQLISLKISGNEFITDYTLQKQEEEGTQYKMSILEDGTVYIDFISEQHKGRVYPETSTVQIGASSFPITYEDGTLTLDAAGSNSVYTFVKKESLSPVVMHYWNDYVAFEDPYLLPWGLVPDDARDSLFLFGSQIWLTEHSYPKDDESEELQEVLNLFNGNNPFTELIEGTHYNYIEDGDAFFMDTLFVTPTYYHYFRMWCMSSDREKYGDIMYDLMANHVYILEYYR